MLVPSVSAFCASACRSVARCTAIDRADCRIRKLFCSAVVIASASESDRGPATGTVGTAGIEGGGGGGGAVAGAGVPGAGGGWRAAAEPSAGPATKGRAVIAASHRFVIQHPPNVFTLVLGNRFGPPRHGHP